MKHILLSLLRLAITLGVVAVAAIIGWRLYAIYELAPWTRDGRVRADTVQVAPDVSGLVTQVAVADDQTVTAGQTLFVIDPARFQLAVRQAQDAITAQQIALDEAQREDRRNRALGELVPEETREQGTAKVAGLQAAVLAAQDTLALAQLNLARATVKAPVAGTVDNLDLLPGTFAAAGKPVLVLIATGSLYVEGYFEETKLPRIALGDPVQIRLMGETNTLTGHVASLAPGIADRERTASASLLPDINPTFSWVRLAQRIPVRIAIDQVPAGVRLIAGRTATVTDTAAHPLPQWPEFVTNLWGKR